MIELSYQRLLAILHNRVRALQVFHVLRQAATLLVAIALPRLVSQEVIGSYELLFYVAYLLVFAWSAGLIQALLALFPQLDEVRRQRLFLQAALLFSGVALLLGVVVYTGRAWLLPMLTGRSTLAWFGPFLIYLLLHIPTLLLENFYLLVNKGRVLLWYSLINAGGFVAAILLPLYLGMGMGVAIRWLIGYAAVRYLWLLVFVYRHGRWQWDAPLLRQWLLLSAPLVAYALLAAVNVSVDSWLVSHWYAGDERTFAIFRYGARELPFVTALTSALGNAMLPVLGAQWASGVVELRRRSTRIYHLIYPLTIVLLLTSGYWFPLVFSAAFAASIPVFNTFLLITASRLLFGRSILIARGGQRILPYIVAGSLVANLLLSYLLIVPLGLLGVAIGTVIAFALESLFTCWWVYRRYGITFGQYTHIGWWLTYVILLLLAYSWTMWSGLG